MFALTPEKQHYRYLTTLLWRVYFSAPESVRLSRGGGHADPYGVFGHESSVQRHFHTSHTLADVRRERARPDS